MDGKSESRAGKGPFTGGTHGPRNRDWWPEHLDIGVLHTNAPAADPMGEAFDYAKEFESLDIDAVIKDLRALMTDSQEWWPADSGHYGGRFIPSAWAPPAIAPLPHAPARPVVPPQAPPPPPSAHG